MEGKDVLTIQDLSKSYDHITLFKHLSLECKRGEHIALIGDNGTGKTTLLKMVNGITKPDNGEILLGSNVYLGYYDQEHNVLNGNNTIFNEISDSYPQLTNTQIRNTLAAFLFTNDDVFKQIKDLSGGEKGRVSLAKLMLSDANFLILDEPTNHLDMISKEILENALNHYEGTVFYVSHDRYFINKTAHRILELSNQALTNYLGNYDYYLEKKIPSSISTAPAWKNTPAANEGDSDLSSLETDTKLDWKQQKEQQAKQRKMDNERNRLEALIETLEGQVEQLEQKMANPIICSNSVKLQEISNELIATQAKLLDAYEKWEEIS